MLMANKIKTGRMVVGIILLGIGAVLSIGTGFIMTIRQWSYEWMLLNLAMVIGVVISVIGLILLITSRKKNLKSPDKSIT